MSLTLGAILMACLAAFAHAQAPTGEIAGRVQDSSGALVPGASISLRNLATGATRDGTTNREGGYGFGALAAGSYEMQAGSPGFRTSSLRVDVATGAVTTVDIRLEIGERKEIVNVVAATPQIEYARHTIDQIVSREQIQELPINGRSFLQLALFSPGAAVSINSLGNYNRAMEVAVLSNNPDKTRIAVDGARINDSIDGGTQQNFSQEVVQEFQISAVNFDLSTGVTAAGAVNIVSRTGSYQ